jgi:sugar lactone lactonase YvrE
MPLGLKQSLPRTFAHASSRCGLLIALVLAVAAFPLGTAHATLYFLDAASGRSYQVTPGGSVSQFPSSGAIGTGYPIPIAVDAFGNLYQFVVGSSRIERITPVGAKSPFATLTGAVQAASAEFDAFGNLFVMDVFGSIRKITPAGVQTTLGVTGSGALASDNLGNLFTIASGNLLKIAPSGTSSILATGLGPSNVFNGLAADSKGAIFATDSTSSSIVKVAPDGTKSTFATGLSSGIFDGLAIDASDNLFVSNSFSGNILMYTSSGVRSTFAQTGRQPESLTFGAPVLIPEPSTILFGVGLSTVFLFPRRRCREKSPAAIESR